MSMFQDANPIVLVISILLQLFAFALGAYYIVVSLFAWLPKKKIPNITDKTHTFALVVAAHNEQIVIKQMVDSLNKLNYPRDAYDIFVIADNCTDKTAEIARKAGAIVYERFHETKRGKGYALEWMFENLFNLERQYDSICIFDADNVVSQNFLEEINKQHNKGFKVVQGNIGSKNPFDTWTTCAYSISFWAIGKLYQLARNNINLSCQLSGTGFAMNTQLLKKLGWGATCLTEDMEFTAKLILNNEKVGWAHDAVVYDEKPLTVSQSFKQRIRWMQGHTDVASNYFLKLMKKFVVDRDFNSFDCAVYLLQPVKVIALGIITVMAWVQTLFPDGNIGFVQLYYLFDNSYIWYAFMLADFLYIPITITSERKTINKRLVIGYLTYWLYSLTWLPITFIGVAKKNQREWFHTQHTRSIEIGEIE